MIQWPNLTTICWLEVIGNNYWLDVANMVVQWRFWWKATLVSWLEREKQRGDKNFPSPFPNHSLLGFTEFQPGPKDGWPRGEAGSQMLNLPFLEEQVPGPNGQQLRIPTKIKHVDFAFLFLYLQTQRLIFSPSFSRIFFRHHNASLPIKQSCVVLNIEIIKHLFVSTLLTGRVKR